MAIRYWFGAVLVAVGAGLLAEQLYPALEFGQWVAKLWPLAIILLGAIVLLTRASTWMGGIFILVLGGFIQLIALGILSENVWGLLFPALLILVGILVIFRLGRTAGSVGKSVYGLDHFVVFSGMNVRPRISNFRGGSVTAAFGGANIDLRDSVLAQEGARLELTAAFGGIDLILPQNWKLDIDGIPLFGGWSNKTAPSASAEGPVLTVRCLAMFGGIELKN
jgi:predicted membrane protein